MPNPASMKRPIQKCYHLFIASFGCKNTIQVYIKIPAACLAVYIIHMSVNRLSVFWLHMFFSLFAGNWE